MSLPVIECYASKFLIIFNFDLHTNLGMINFNKEKLNVISF